MKTVTQTTQFVEIYNLCDFPLYFKRLTDSGDVRIDLADERKDFLPLEEVEAQIRVRNRLFVGDDGRGSHARILIVDDDIRKSLLLLKDGEAPELLTLDAVKGLLSINDRSKFERRLKELVVTRAERRMISRLAEKAGVDNVAAWKGKIIDSLFENISVFQPGENFTTKAYG